MIGFDNSINQIRKQWGTKTLRIIVAGLLELWPAKSLPQTEDTETPSALDKWNWMWSSSFLSFTPPVLLLFTWGDARSLQTSFLLHFAPSPLGFPPGRQHGAVSCSSRRLSFTLLLRSYITQALVFLPQPSVILTLFNIHSQLKSLLRGSGGTF